MDETRPEHGSPLELIWLRGFEAGVIRCRADHNAVIRKLIEKAEKIPLDGRSPVAACRVRTSVAQWLKSQMEGE